MRILYLSKEADGLWMAHILLKNGHKVDIALKQEKFSNTLKGILPPLLDEAPESVEDYDLVVFDSCDSGKAADRMRKETPVIGSSDLAQRLEEDRLFGIEFMEKAGITVPPYEVFNDVGKATKWIKDSGKPSVFKPFGNELDKSTTYVSHSPEDMIRYLDKLTSKVKVKEFLLQEVVEGTEVSTEGWFNGEEFYGLNHTLEEKKFMSGGIGPNTGCSGNALWMPDSSNPLFERGLRRAATLLRNAGFVGPIDLNTIVNEKECYGLEWTPRFGYEGTCNLTRLLPMEFGEFMYQIATGETPKLGEPKANFAATIRVTVPPYPNPSKPEKYGGVPVHGIDVDKLEEFYLSDVQMNEDEELETIGADGWIGSPIGIGDTIAEAFKFCEEYIEKLDIPDLMWRNDVRECCERRYAELEKHGWLKFEKAANG